MESSGTALGAARQRFLGGLSAHAEELEADLAAYTSDPRGVAARIRARVRELHGASKVFRIRELERSLGGQLERLLRDSEDRISAAERAMLVELASLLRRFEGADAAAPSKSPSDRPVPSPMRRRRSGSAVRASRAARRSVTSGRPGLTTPVSILAVGEIPSFSRWFDAGQFEVEEVEGPKKALVRARVLLPDVVFVREEHALKDSSFVTRLRSDPMAEDVLVVVVGEGAWEAWGADATLSPQASRNEALEIARLAVPNESPKERVSAEWKSLGELVERLVREFRLGTIESLVGGDTPLHVENPEELTASVWSLVAKVREVAEGSGAGRVRFRDDGRPSLLSSLIAEDEASSGALRGRRVLIVDDDPAVVWFYAGVFREEGSVVLEAHDGLEALEIARLHAPDVILSDILMPRMDGVSFCRALRHDPALAQVPVVLMSWREDYLHRMRELRAEASAYTRKEAAANQIVAQAEALLRPLARLQERLREGGEFRGRLDSIGAPRLLQETLVARERGRIAVRDARRFYEVIFEEGAIREVSATSVGGAYATGDRALIQLLGATSGRFTVIPVDSLRSSVSGAPRSSLQELLERLGATVQAVQGRAASQIASLELDVEIAREAHIVSAGPSRDALKALIDGATPRDLLTLGVHSPAAIEDALTDLAFRGAITSVKALDDADLIEEALEDRASARSDEPLTPIELVSERPSKASRPSIAPILAVGKEAPKPKRKTLEIAPEDAPISEADDDLEVEIDVTIEPRHDDETVSVELEDLRHAPINPAPRVPKGPEPSIIVSDLAYERESRDRISRNSFDSEAETEIGEPDSKGLGVGAWLLLFAIFALIAVAVWRMSAPAPQVPRGMLAPEEQQRVTPGRPQDFENIPQPTGDMARVLLRGNAPILRRDREHWVPVGQAPQILELPAGEHVFGCESEGRLLVRRLELHAGQTHVLSLC